MNKVVIATTTFSPTFDLRLKLAVKTVEIARSQNYEVVIVDGGSPVEFRDIVRRAGAMLFDETVRGMGPSRRQAKLEAGKLAGIDGVVVWMEPEKHTFVNQISRVTMPLINGSADLVIPARKSLHTYPREQQHAEEIGNLAAYYLTGKKLDFWFGPRVMNRLALDIFLKYDGRYGDKWDSIQIPVLECIAAGLNVVGVEVDYSPPAEQTKTEEGNVGMLIKRIDQLQNLVPSLAKAAEILGLQK